MDEEQFQQLLFKGGELLAAGKVIEAKEELERAFAYDGKNEKCQNLLGLTYFKLGLFDRASELYELLVRENPADPTLRVNLGLVYLKTNALARAIREFETATDLAPEHKKAQNYLGLALAQGGEYGRAREHFLLAGSDAMAEKMTRAIAGEAYVKTEPPKQIEQKRGFAEIEGSEVVAERGGEVVGDVSARVKAKARMPGTTPPPARLRARAKEGRPADSSAPCGGEEDDWGASFEDHDPQPPRPRVSELPNTSPSPGTNPTPCPGPRARTRSPLPPPSPSRRRSSSRRPTWPSRTPRRSPKRRRPRPRRHRPRARRSSRPRFRLRHLEAAPARRLKRPIVRPGPPPLLAEYAIEARVLEGANAQRGPFEIREDSVAIVVQDELLTRLSGLLAYHGSIQFSLEHKRVRGRTTDKPFGEGDAQMTRAKGEGALVVSSGAQLFFAVELGDESAYFREEVLFAFEEPLSYENGRVPCQISPDLELVHLRGKGKALLALSGPMRSLEVRMDRPATIPLQHLIGWQGNLTPKVVPLLPGVKGQSAVEGVELSGEGFALFAAPLG